MHPEAPRRLRNFAIVFAGPPLLVFILVGGSYLLGARKNVGFIELLTFIAPIIGVSGIFFTHLRGAFKFFLAVIYLPLCAGGVFLLGISVGCGWLRMYCW